MLEAPLGLRQLGVTRPGLKQHGLEPVDKLAPYGQSVVLRSMADPGPGPRLPSSTLKTSSAADC